MKKGWLLYDKRDYEANRMFASHAQMKGLTLGLSLRVVVTHDFDKAIAHPPDFMISRQRNHLLSAALEAKGVPVFNHSRVCEICNDKRKTHQFLKGLPRMKTLFLEPDDDYTPDAAAFPLVVKPAFGHGGDLVSLAEDQTQLAEAISAIYPAPPIVQEVASGAGRDLRIYVLFGQIIAAVMRTAKSGIVSNYKKGGSVALHEITDAERELAGQVMRRFADADAPLSFAGIDLLYHQGRPVVNEIEDVVGSRMLYQVSDLDIIDLFMHGIAGRLSA